MARYRISVKPLGLELECASGAVLLDALRDAGIGMESACGGLGTCGRCRVRVLAGEMNGITPAETDHLPPEMIGEGMRLACQARPESDTVLYLPASSLTTQQRLQTESGLRVEAPDPAVRACDVELELPLPPAAPDLDPGRVEAALRAAVSPREDGGGKLEAGDVALREAAGVFLAGGGRARAVMRDGELLGVVPRSRSPLGLAVDLGSTKVACFLYDLAGGELLARRGLLNPQIPYGEDIIARIQQAGAGHARRLGRLVAEEIGAAAAEMAAEAGRQPEDIFEMVLVGNTAMHHLFLSLPVEQLGRSPYLPATVLPLERKARGLGLEFSPAAAAFFPPPIAGFVGSDHLAAVCAVRLWERTGPCLLLDIGTNTEVALLAGGVIRCCSCASGPAFEGGGLSRGMRAGEGAIDEVALDPSSGRMELSVIGEAAPAGICGSGILSALAVLAEAGIVDAGGRMWDDRPGVTVLDGETAFFLSPPDEGGSGGVAVTQGDIREIQKAKGAIRAGVDALMMEAGIGSGELEEVMLAGAFGTYIDPADALEIALLPPVPVGIVNQVGNAAGIGACSMLLSRRARSEAVETAGRMEYLELASYPRLGHLFAAGMYLSEDAVRDAKRRFRI